MKCPVDIFLDFLYSLFAGLWLLLEDPQTETKKRQGPFRSFHRWRMPSRWFISSPNDVAYNDTVFTSLGGSVPPVQQVLCQTQQPGSHSLSDREGNVTTCRDRLSGPPCRLVMYFIKSSHKIRVTVTKTFCGLLLLIGCTHEYVWASRLLLCGHRRGHGQRQSQQEQRQVCYLHITCASRDEKKRCCKCRWS